MTMMEQYPEKPDSNQPQLSSIDYTTKMGSPAMEYVQAQMQQPQSSGAFIIRQQPAMADQRMPLMNQSNMSNNPIMNHQMMNSNLLNIQEGQTYSTANMEHLLSQKIEGLLSSQGANEFLSPEKDTGETTNVLRMAS